MNATNPYIGRYPNVAYRKRVWREIVRAVSLDAPKAESVLELGAGYCDFINQIRAARKYALDANPDVADYCMPDVRFLHQPAGSPIEIPHRSVDVVLASNLLEHLSDRQRSDLFDQFENLLNERGKIILIQPNYYYCYREYWDDFTHVKAFSHVSLTDFLLSRGYKIVRAEKRFLPFSFKSALPKSYWITRLYLLSSWRPFAKQMLIVAER